MAANEQLVQQELDRLQAQQSATLRQEAERRAAAIQQQQQAARLHVESQFAAAVDEARDTVQAHSVELASMTARFTALAKELPALQAVYAQLERAAETQWQAKLSAPDPTGRQRATLPNAVLPVHALIGWIAQTSDPTEYRYRQGIAYAITGQLFNPKPDFNPQTETDFTRRKQFFR